MYIHLVNVLVKVHEWKSVYYHMHNVHVRSCLSFI